MRLSGLIAIAAFWAVGGAALAQGNCDEGVAHCAAECRARTFIGDPKRETCAAACREKGRLCRQSATAPCATPGSCTAATPVRR